MGYCNYTSFQTRCHKVKKNGCCCHLYMGSLFFICPLRFSHKNDVQFVFSSSCLQENSCLIYIMCVYLCTKVSNTYCVVYLFCFSSSCVTCVALDCPFPNIYLTSFFKINSGKVYSIQQYAIKVVDNLRQVGGFLFGL